MKFRDRDLGDVILMLATIIVFLIVAFAILSNAKARDIDGRYGTSPYKEWFSKQKNSRGDFCCDDADGHPFFGPYKLNEDGSVTLVSDGETLHLAADMVLIGPNPTGHAVWWFLVDGAGKRQSRCFAPGSMG